MKLLKAQCPVCGWQVAVAPGGFFVKHGRSRVAGGCQFSGGRASRSMTEGEYRQEQEQAAERRLEHGRAEAEGGIYE